MKIKNEKEIYNILPEELRNEYTIGFHGFNGSERYWKKNEQGIYQLDESKIQQAKDSILSQGLRFPKGRFLLSTTKFGDLSQYVSSKDTWLAGGVIIALPKVLQNEHGDKIFIGGPDEKNIKPYWDRNSEPTTLSEIMLPADGLLGAEFIIGSYSKVDEGIEVVINPNHIAFNKGIVSDDFFDDRKAQFSEILLNREPIIKSILDETAMQKQLYYKTKIISLATLGKKAYQHYGPEIAGKLKGIVSNLKKEFFGKDEIQDEIDKNGEEK